MISEPVLKALNHQVNEELYSWYVYTAMANHFEHIALKGFSAWFQKQAMEEMGHAQRIMNYIHDRGATVDLQAIKAPPATWTTPLAAVEAAYKHECHISASINELANTAAKEGDQMTHNFLNWFITEQVEEEALVDNVVQQLRYVQDSPAALFMMDRDIGSQRAADASAT